MIRTGRKKPLTSNVTYQLQDDHLSIKLQVLMPLEGKFFAGSPRGKEER
jgi:hypothetical protein